MNHITRRARAVAASHLLTSLSRWMAAYQATIHPSDRNTLHAAIRVLGRHANDSHDRMPDAKGIPLVEGGQGRTPQSLVETAMGLLLLTVVVVVILALLGVAP